MEQQLIELLKSGNLWTAVCVIIAIGAKDSIPVIIRKMQGQNGRSTIRGQLDEISEKISGVHDMATRHDERIKTLEREMGEVKARCDRNH